MLASIGDFGNRCTRVFDHTVCDEAARSSGIASFALQIVPVCAWCMRKQRNNQGEDPRTPDSDIVEKGSKILKRQHLKRLVFAV